MYIEKALKKVVEGHDLNEHEAYNAINEIMTGQAADVHIAGFLIALRMKGESVEEILGGTRALAEKANRISPKVGLCVDPVGTGGDGTQTFNISSASALLAAASGAHVAKHGNRSISSQSGSADFYESIGININLSPKAVEKCIEDTGFGFMYAPNFHPAMRFAGPIRRQLGVRNIFNILGPLSNPAGAQAQVLGVYDKSLMPFIAQTLQRLGEVHALVVHSADGADEIMNTGETYILDVFRDRIEEYTISAEDFGMTSYTLKDLAGGTPQDNVQIVLDIFNGKKGPCRDVVVLNAAATLYAANIEPSIKDAVSRVCKALDSGKAMEKLEEIRLYTQEHADESVS